MVDRIQRDATSRVLRSFIDGAITNDEFEAQFPRSDEDSALPAIKANVWMLYSDLHRHKLTGKHEPNAETRALLERCVLFLETNLEFEWPVPKIGLSNILPNLWLQAKARLGSSPMVPAITAAGWCNAIRKKTRGKSSCSICLRIVRI
jgi:hypothetical protein